MTLSALTDDLFELEAVHHFNLAAHDDDGGVFLGANCELGSVGGAGQSGDCNGGGSDKAFHFVFFVVSGCFPDTSTPVSFHCRGKALINPFT